MAALLGPGLANAATTTGPTVALPPGGAEATVTISPGGADCAVALDVQEAGRWRLVAVCNVGPGGGTAHHRLPCGTGGGLARARVLDCAGHTVGVTTGG